MKKSKLVEGHIYKFDPMNLLQQPESGVNKVLLKKINRFKKNVIVVPFTARGVKMEDEMEVSPEFLYELEGFGGDIMVRYPIDIPVFSQKDYQILLTASKIILEDPNVTAQFAVGLQSLLSKVEYYSAIAALNRPVIIEDKDE